MVRVSVIYLKGRQSESKIGGFARAKQRAMHTTQRTIRGGDMGLSISGVTDAARLDRERAFHNQRFAEDIQDEARAKYYCALSGASLEHHTTVRAAAIGADILEYGCAKGEMANWLANEACSVRGIDISDIAIAHANRQAAAAGVTNAEFTVADALQTGFADESFDVVYGSGIIHHLDIDAAFREIHRVLRPGGVALFSEPMVGNIVLRMYRRATPESRTADEHPLTKADLELATRIFSGVSVKHYGLLSIGVVPFWRTRLEPIVYKVLAFLDALIFKVPGMRWQAWSVTMRLTR